MRQNLKDIVTALAELVPFAEPIVELGALQVETQIGFADLRPIFPGKQYIGCDMRPGPGVDRLENMHRLGFADGTVGSLVCLDTLEHVANVHYAAAEMYRVLAPGGICVLATVMDFEIHEFPADYWRFTPKAIELLMRRFAGLQIYAQGSPEKPHTVLGIGRRGAPLPPTLAARLATIPPEPLVPIALGLGADADADAVHEAGLAAELAAARAALAASRAELEAVHASAVWRLAEAIRALPLVGGPLRAAARRLVGRSQPRR